MRNVMIDIECLGTQPGSVILSIGACVFGKAENQSMSVCIDTFDSLMNGLTVDRRTCKWWANQPAKARFTATYEPKTLVYALDKLSKFIAKDDFVWAKGPDFDLVLLAEAYRVIDEPIPWSFRNSRDVRTILHLANKRCKVEVTREECETKHDALFDAMFQARQVLQAARILEVYIG